MQRRVEDDVLVKRLKSSDPAAMDDLERSYRARISQLAFRYMKNHEDAEEVTQDVLLRVFRKIDAFRGEATLSSWIYRITFNAAMSRLRSAKFRRPLEISEADLAMPSGDRGPNLLPDYADRSSLADDELYRVQLRHRLVASLIELPPIYRFPVLLRDVQGLSTAEASAILKLKPQTLKSRLHRGRLILRERLSEFSSGLSLHAAA